MSDLLSPLRVKTTTFRNRFVLPAMQRSWGKDYAPTKRMSDYYRRCVRGGVGLVISESAGVDHPSVTGHPDIVMILRPASALAWKDCIDAVHEEGGRMFVQLWHEGAVRKEHASGPDPSYPTLSPSGLIRKGHPNGRAATIGELREIRNAYVEAALLVKSLGADGVEIHGAHGYFLDQFMWSETNERSDQYGGVTLAERARYPAEIVRAIRDAVGGEFLISFRFSQWKEVDFNARIAESPAELEAMLKVMRQAGVDIFHASTRRFSKPEWPGRSLGLAGWVKSFTDAPVITVGSVGLNLDLMDMMYTNKELTSEVEQAMEVLNARFANGEFDFVAVGRSIMGDQEWVNKVIQHRYADIVPFKRDVLREALEGYDDATIRQAQKDI